jgi:fatty acid desaturase
VPDACFYDNNYHAVQHDLPHVPWFALRNVYAACRQQYMERSGGFLVQSYSEWLRLLHSVKLTHPLLLNANAQDKSYKIRARDSMYEQHDRIQP